MIVPHIIDQCVWNHMIRDLGAGTKGMPIDKLNQLDFEQKLLDLLNNRSHKFVLIRSWSKCQEKSPRKLWLHDGMSCNFTGMSSIKGEIG